MGSIWHPLSSTVNPIVTATLQSRTLPSMEHRIERKRFTTDTSVWLKGFPGAVCSTQRPHHRQIAAREDVYGVFLIHRKIISHFSLFVKGTVALCVYPWRRQGLWCPCPYHIMFFGVSGVRNFANIHTIDGNWRKVSEKLCKVYDMVDEVFMKCVNVVESLDEGLTKIAQGSVRFVICCW